MTSSSKPTGSPPADGCAELRADVERTCAEAHSAKASHEAASEKVRGLRRDLTSVGHRHEEAVAAADPEVRTAEKAAARDVYRLANVTADDDEAVREATAAYGKAIDRINRSSQLRQREIKQRHSQADALEAELHETERLEQTARLLSDQAEAACLDARVRLASCEERTTNAGQGEHATISEPHAATGGHAVAIGEGGAGAPLVIESMVSGDRVALELAAARVAEQTGLTPAEVQLQLQELVDAIISVASTDGYLVFDTSVPFWSSLTLEEARDMVAALDRLGFAFEPSEGWHAGRAPTQLDLSMALAYAGLDARNMRDLPSTEELQALPASIGVDARAFLAANAPELTVDNVVRVLDRRAAPLEPLWNEWGQIRPILLADRHSLGSSSG